MCLLYVCFSCLSAHTYKHTLHACTIVVFRICCSTFLVIAFLTLLINFQRHLVINLVLWCNTSDWQLQVLLRPTPTPTFTLVQVILSKPLLKSTQLEVNLSPWPTDGQGRAFPSIALTVDGQGRAFPSIALTVDGQGRAFPSIALTPTRKFYSCYPAKRYTVKL
jgi:hypothetical protein